MSLANIQVGKLVQTIFSQIVVVQVNKQEDSAHSEPTDNVQEDLLLHQQPLKFPNTTVDSVIVGWLRLY